MAKLVGDGSDVAFISVKSLVIVLEIARMLDVPVHSFVVRRKLHLAAAIHVLSNVMPLILARKINLVRLRLLSLVNVSI